MMQRVGQDVRIAVVTGLATHAELGDRVVAGAWSAAGTHPVSCACCRARGPLATALARLFFRIARGEEPMPRRILVAGGDAAAVREAVERDILLRVRLRFDGPA